MSSAAALRDLDEGYGERCASVSPACRPSRMDETAVRFFAQVLAATCDTHALTCDTTTCSVTRGAPRAARFP